MGCNIRGSSLMTSLSGKNARNHRYGGSRQPIAQLMAKAWSHLEQIGAPVTLPHLSVLQSLCMQTHQTVSTRNISGVGHLQKLLEERLRIQPLNDRRGSGG